MLELSEEWNTAGVDIEGNSSGDTSEVINNSEDEERSCKHFSQHIQPTIAL